MSKVKINRKDYDVPELNFRHSQIMEQCGLPVEGMVSRKYLLTAVQAFTVIVTKVEPEYAYELIQQHIMGGGNLEDIYKAYVQALKDSAFFKKLLHLNGQEKKSEKKVTTTEETENE